MNGARSISKSSLARRGLVVALSIGMIMTVGAGIAEAGPSRLLAAAPHASQRASAMLQPGTGGPLLLISLATSDGGA